MKGIQQVFSNRRLRGEAAWNLLALDNAPVALGLLQAHLYDKEKKLPHSILLERLRQDLEQLRAEGLDLPQPAELYLANWLRAGYLVRAFEAGASEEEYTLSLAAVRAIRFIQSLQEQRIAATESRLSLVIGQLCEIAEQTEADPERRVQALLRERERLDEEIAQVRAGVVTALPEERALERTREVIGLARELTADFRQVQDRFQQLNRDLREQIVDNEGSRGDVLDKVFSGIDMIAESDAGKSFRAFWRLLTDPERALAFEVALDELLSRDFAHGLERHERRFLIQLTRALLDEGGEVHDSLQHFARGLKQFVQSRAYQEQRRLNRLLGEAQRQALAARETIKPTADIGQSLELTSANLRSLAQWYLHDPSRDRLHTTITRAAEAEISLETVGELLAQSEIDFRRLREQIAAMLAEQAQFSIAELLARYPAEQGLGSVVGLLALGVREGVRSREYEQVRWRGLDEVERCARIPKIHFLREKFDARAG